LIVLYHNNKKVLEVISAKTEVLPFGKNDTIASVLIDLGIRYPKSKIIWCHEDYRDFLNLEKLNEIFHHDKMMLSFNPCVSGFLGKEIFYIDESPFLNVNKEVAFATWLATGWVGGIHASVLLEIKDKINYDSDFDYYLSSIAKLCMPLGLLCYSESRLLQKNNVVSTVKPSRFRLFKFVKQHYKTRWIFLLLLNLFLYERRFALLPFMYSLFWKRRKLENNLLDKIEVKSAKKVVNKGTVDVIIPTIGRKEYLYDFLKDLAAQTHLPNKVIIVEQNPIQESSSDLDYLTLQTWPFVIKHIFTHRAGACNARNLALKEVESEWTFFADDDIRVDHFFIQKTLQKIEIFGTEAASLRCLQKGEIQKGQTVFQWKNFGSGCSFVSTNSLKNCLFNMGYEFGFGEDTDFGMQLRNKGYDVLYLPEPEILHLKAPIGGFRTKPILQWKDDVVQPKPSPTIMLYMQTHLTKEQVLGYKTVLFFKFYKVQTIKNPIRYFNNFKRQWEKSTYWANQLKNKA
jgi:glycosyltransferase involved in cell wall biosynthesis